MFRTEGDELRLRRCLFVTEKLVALRDAAAVHQADDRQDEQHTRTYEGGQGGPTCDGADGPERVGREEQAAQRRSLEHRVDRLRQLCVRRVALELARQFGIGLAAAYLLQMVGDEVVGVD